MWILQFNLEYQYFIRLYGPFRLELQRTHLHSFGQVFEPEPAGFAAAFSGSYLALTGQ